MRREAIATYCEPGFSLSIDIIDYVTGIGNRSREQYNRAGDP